MSRNVTYIAAITMFVRCDNKARLFAREGPEEFMNGNFLIVTNFKEIAH